MKLTLEAHNKYSNNKKEMYLFERDVIDHMRDIMIMCHKLNNIKFIDWEREPDLYRLNFINNNFISYRLPMSGNMHLTFGSYDLNFNMPVELLWFTVDEVKTLLISSIKLQKDKEELKNQEYKTREEKKVSLLSKLKLTKEEIEILGV